MDEKMTAPVVQTDIIDPVGEAQINDMLKTLRSYHAAKHRIDSRIKAAENWWKMRNEVEEDKQGHDKKGFRSKSGWLHNVIQNKGADTMEAYPEPNFLPREETDKAQAKILSKVVPCILEQNRFENVYAEVSANNKVKFGTGVYKVVWDASLLGGMGDISISKRNVLNLFWEPGVEDIQQSKYFFEVEMVDEDIIRQQHPDKLPEGRAIPKEFIADKMPTDEKVDTESKVPLVHAYYKKKGILHYCFFVPGTLLFASENEAEYANGWYAHGKYPYVFDALFRVEGSPCGYGYVDLCAQQQVEIDLLKTAYVENAMVGAKPRYFKRANNGINREQFLDLNETLVEVEGNLDDTYLRPITHDNLDGNYINMLTLIIDELRETTGNTDAATGTTPSGVTSASGIAALQEASGKISRSNNMGTYRAYAEVVDLVVEDMRQFYTMPRMFRITGEMGEETFISYDNSGIKPVPQIVGGQNVGDRKPIFDIKVVPQKRTAYTKMANNDLALQFYNLGFFNPQMADQALACLAMMDFDSLEDVKKIVQRNGDLMQRYQLMMQFAVALAQKYKDGEALAMLQQIAMQGGMQVPEAMPDSEAPAEMPTTEGKEHPFVEKARAQAQAAATPTEGNMA